MLLGSKQSQRTEISLADLFSPCAHCRVNLGRLLQGSRALTTYSTGARVHRIHQCFLHGKKKKPVHPQKCSPLLPRILRNLCCKVLWKVSHSQKPVEEPSYRTPKVLQNFGSQAQLLKFQTLQFLLLLKTKGCALAPFKRSALARSFSRLQLLGSNLDVHFVKPPLPRRKSTVEAPKRTARHFPDLVSAEASGPSSKGGRGPDSLCFLPCKCQETWEYHEQGTPHEPGPLATDKTHTGGGGGAGCFWMESKCKRFQMVC